MTYIIIDVFHLSIICHQLPIEIGRWNNIWGEERKCNLCNTNDLGDEFHYMFSCDQIDIKTMRKKCLHVYYHIIIETLILLSLKNFLIVRIKIP